MGVIEDLMMQATTPAQGSSSALGTLQTLASLGAIKGMGPSNSGGGPGSGLTDPGVMGSAGGIGLEQYRNWAERYGVSGVPESQLVPLLRGSYPMTDNALFARPDMAAAARTAARAYHQDTGDWLLHQLVSAWRPFQSGSSKATSMKNSDHWLAGALDFGANSSADMWLRAHGAQYGFAPAAAGFNWGDPGHFSFTAGGFEGSHSASGASWGDPLATDLRWIRLAQELYGR